MKCVALLFAALAVAGVHCLDAEYGVTQRWEGMGQDLNIIDLADRLGIYSFLLALKETNLTQTVRDAHDITVFIPINKAFTDLPDSARDYWRAHPQEYKNQMKYHIVQGRFPTELLADELLLTTLDQQLKARFNIYNHSSTPTILRTYEGSVVSSGNFSASNGFIHLIDQIVDQYRIPINSTVSLVDSEPTLTKLAQVVDAARSEKVKQALTRNNTLFAPNDEAFSKLPPKSFEDLLKDRQRCETLVLAHISQFGAYFTNGIIDGELIPTVDWLRNITVTKKADAIKFGTANAVTVNKATTNGVIHIVDTILFSFMFGNQTSTLASH